MHLSTQDIATLDEFVREWLLLRGFTRSLSHFDDEHLDDCTFGLNSIKVAEHLILLASTAPFSKLASFWKGLDSLLSPVCCSTAEKIYASLVKLHLSCLLQSSSFDLIVRFFKENPGFSNDPTYVPFLTAAFSPSVPSTLLHWSSTRTTDLLKLSIANFFSILFSSARLPSLLVPPCTGSLFLLSMLISNFFFNFFLRYLLQL
ncbi:hypothetical protein GEMRC1_014143 [Eukaryota sp. GEM-RC1]